MKPDLPKTCGACDHCITGATAFACGHPDLRHVHRIVRHNTRPPSYCPIRIQRKKP